MHHNSKHPKFILNFMKPHNLGLIEPNADKEHVYLTRTDHVMIDD